MFGTDINLWSKLYEGNVAAKAGQGKLKGCDPKKVIEGQ